MFRKMMDPDNEIVRILTKATDVFGLSLLWLVCCLPLFTIGPATTALYNATVRCVKGDRNYPFALFFRTFRENFKVGSLTSLVLLAIAAVLWMIQNILAAATARIELMGIYYSVFLFVMILPLGIISYLFPVLSRFTFGVRGLLSTTVRLAMSHFPTTLFLGALLAVSGIFCMWLLMPFGFMPVVLTLIQSCFLEKIFRPYEEAQTDSNQ